MGPSGGRPPVGPSGGHSPAGPGGGRLPGAPTRSRPPTAPAGGRAPGAPARSPARTTPASSPLRSAAPGGSPLLPPRDATVPSPGGGAPTLTAPAEGFRRPAPQPRPTDLFADRLLAVLSGQRPVHCMLRHTVGRAYDELAWLAERGPLRARGTRPVVRDIGYYEPRPGAIEAFARIGAGEQLRAMAFRLEQGPDLRWRCTAVELGGPRMPRADDD
ncbi:Rv3235 family protein [Streptomyces sp. NBC_01615]